MSGENTQEIQEAPVVKARGLPWSATEKDVIEFFSDVDVVNGETGIHFTYTKDGRPSGECFLEVATYEDLEKALAHDNEHMGKRYIEVKEAKHSEMEWVVNRMNQSSQGGGDGVVRLRGLPYGCSKQDIASFFEGLQIIPYGITITMDQDGRASGDAYVEFASQDDAEKALLKHKEKIGHRYIEIFKSSKNDIKYVVAPRHDARPSLMNLRPGPYDRPMGGDRFGFHNSRARGRGGMNLGPSGFNTSSNFGSNYDFAPRGPRGGKGGAMRGGRSMGGGGGMGGMNKMVPQNSKTGHSVHMRGLPFEATVNDVLTFFAPLNPVDVRLLYEQNTGRPKGECDVDFATHTDAEAAMQKDKQNMGHRYIELFIKSTPNGNSWNTGPSQMNRGAPMQNSYGGNGNVGMGGGGAGGPSNAYANNNMGGGMNSLMGNNAAATNYNFKSFAPPDHSQVSGGYPNQPSNNNYFGMR